MSPRRAKGSSNDPCPLCRETLARWLAAETGPQTSGPPVMLCTRCARKLFDLLGAVHVPKRREVSKDQLTLFAGDVQ